VRNRLWAYCYKKFKSDIDRVRWELLRTLVFLIKIAVLPNAIPRAV
jgi:hypothetical protein